MGEPKVIRFSSPLGGMWEAYYYPEGIDGISYRSPVFPTKAELERWIEKIKKEGGNRESETH